MDKKSTPPRPGSVFTANGAESYRRQVSNCQARREASRYDFRPGIVNRALHCGPRSSTTLQDSDRLHRCAGSRTLWQPGQDHADRDAAYRSKRCWPPRAFRGRRDLGREDFRRRVEGRIGGTIVSSNCKRPRGLVRWDHQRVHQEVAPAIRARATRIRPNFPRCRSYKVFVEMLREGLHLSRDSA